MTLVLGVDPGKTTGLGLIEVRDKKIELRTMMESKDLSCSDYLDLLQAADIIVVEDFLVRPKNARTGNFDWDPMYAPQVIGAVNSLAAQLKKQVVKQQPAIKPAGYGYSNQRYVKGKKGMHIQDALAHAVYYAVVRLKALPLDSGKHG